MNTSTMNIEELKAELKSHGIELHHKTGIAKLQETLDAARAGTYVAPDDAPKPEEIETKDISAVKILSHYEQFKLLPEKKQAMVLRRIIVTPNDPNMNDYPGMIFSVASSRVTKGKMIKKYVPFANEEGWHVPDIIYNHIKNAEMQKFKQVKMANGEKQPQAYITKRYSVELLPPLTREELKALAAAQGARGDA